ncbi:MAG: CoA transferase [Sphingobium sp.]
MNGMAAALAAAARDVQAIAALTDGRVALDAAALLDRSDAIPLAPPGPVSANGSCRILRAADGWIAANLPREDDFDLVPAWTGCAFGDPPWAAVEAAARSEPAAEFVAHGALLGLAVARLGEAAPSPPPRLRPAGARKGPLGKTLLVLDLSTLWAGPLCAGLLAQAGHEVRKVESMTRPDPLARSAPAHDARLNGLKRRESIAFTAAALRPLMAQADIIVTSARPRAFEALGLGPDALFAMKPHAIWIAITGHGWSGAAGLRTGFGDDAAVAGGLVDWQGGRPVFAGDALADPLTGLGAARAALEAIHDGGGVLIDMALAQTAARAATA